MSKHSTILSILLFWTVVRVQSDLDDDIDIWLFKNVQIFGIRDAAAQLADNRFFNKTKPFVLLVHGIDRNANSTFVNTLVDALVASGRSTEFNLMAVNADKPLYTQGFKPKLYYGVLKNLHNVGARIGAFLVRAIDLGLTAPDRIHLAGYSIGAHTSGYAARLVKQERGEIASITGLDAAGPGFGSKSSFSAWLTHLIHLSKDDAKTVHLLHTNAYWLGSSRKSLGDASYVFNNGIIQPGCYKATIREHCSHSRINFFYSEAITHKDRFIGRKCGSWWKFSTCMCNNKATSTITFPPDPKAKGVYYLHTGSKSPFGREMDGASCSMRSKHSTEPSEDETKEQCCSFLS